MPGRRVNWIANLQDERDQCWDVEIAVDGEAKIRGLRGEAADYAGFAARQAEARRQGRHIGIGISNAVEGPGLGPYEGATVRISETGKVVVYAGDPTGAISQSTLARIAADPLGISYEDVRVATADSANIALGMGRFAARTAVNAGSWVHLAALALPRRSGPSPAICKAIVNSVTRKTRMGGLQGSSRAAAIPVRSARQQMST